MLVRRNIRGTFFGAGGCHCILCEAGDRVQDGCMKVYNSIAFPQGKAKITPYHFSLFNIKQREKN